MTPGSLELAQPGWLWLYPLLILLALLWRRHAPGQARHNSLARPSGDSPLAVWHPMQPLLTVSPVEPHAGWQWLKTAVLWLALASLVVALAQPVRIGKQRPDPPSERDIVFIVDTGVSMILRDYLLDGQRVARITLLKGLLDRFVQSLHGERIAVIVFAESAWTFVPLSRDSRLVRRMLSRIETGMAGRFKAMGEAIALAVRDSREAPRRKRLMILFSDANQTTGRITPQAAAELAAEAGIPLYTVAIGAASYAAEEQRKTGLIYHPVDRALLDALARRTGAQSYRATDPAALEKAIADIERREKNLRKTEPRYYRIALYPWPLLAGLLLLILLSLSGLVPRRKP